MSSKNNNSALTGSAEDQEKIAMADAIRILSKGVEQLLESGIKRRDIEVLLTDRCKVGRKTIGKVLDALESLAADYPQ